MDKRKKQKLENESIDHLQQNEKLQVEQEFLDIGKDKDFQDIFQKIQDQDQAFHNKSNKGNLDT